MTGDLSSGCPISASRTASQGLQDLVRGSRVRLAAPNLAGSESPSVPARRRYPAGEGRPFRARRVVPPSSNVVLPQRLGPQPPPPLKENARGDYLPARRTGRPVDDPDHVLADQQQQPHGQ